MRTVDKVMYSPELGQIKYLISSPVPLLLISVTIDYCYLWLTFKKKKEDSLKALSDAHKDNDSRDTNKTV